MPETEGAEIRPVDVKADTPGDRTTPQTPSSPKLSRQESPTAISATLPASEAFPSGYDYKHYEDMLVESSIKHLFTYIGRYQPQRRQLETELKPFIPDYIAAVGDVDEFLKPPRPDGETETLGLRVLDEPSAKQSDPAILRKLARSTMKGTAALADNDDFDAAIRHDDEERNQKIDAWIESVEKLRDAQAVGEVCNDDAPAQIDSETGASAHEVGMSRGTAATCSMVCSSNHQIAFLLLTPSCKLGRKSLSH